MENEILLNNFPAPVDISGTKKNIKSNEELYL